MALMTGKEYIESLKKMKPVVYLFGEKIEDPTSHPIIKPSQNAIALTYDLAFNPEYEDIMTAHSNLIDGKVNRFTHIYQSKEDLIMKDVQEKDLDVGVAMTDVKGDRLLRPSEQKDKDLYLRIVKQTSDGIIVRGAKANQTGSVNVHYIFVAPTCAMREDDKDYLLLWYCRRYRRKEDALRNIF